MLVLELGQTQKQTDKRLVCLEQATFLSDRLAVHYQPTGIGRPGDKTSHVSENFKGNTGLFADFAFISKLLLEYH